MSVDRASTACTHPDDERRAPSVGPSVTAAEDESRQNEHVRQTIAARIERELIPVPAGSSRAPIATSDWAIHDYSSCFSVEWMDAGRRTGVFVKIPKVDINRRAVLPRTDADRHLAEHEYESLVYLKTHWNAPATASYVEPLAFYRDLNAIVTRRAYALDFFPDFRCADAVRKMGLARSGDVAKKVSGQLGTALRVFHRNTRAAEGFGDEPFTGVAVVDKIARIADDLRSCGVSEVRLRALLAEFDLLRVYRGTSAIALTLKGLDVRNVLIDGERRVHLLDPGKLKRDFHQADVARMLVTFRIVYWGSLWFFVHARPDCTYERTFLDRYYDGPPDDAVILRLYIVKELFKHWRAAYVALTRKQWPKPLEALLGRRYIDAFYARAVTRELARFPS